jgi:putative intracellular protease/amidase
MGNALKGKKIAILVADGFEQVELTGPKEALEAAGAEIEIVSPAEEEVQGWNHDEKADRFPVDMPLNLARSDDYVAGRRTQSRSTASVNEGSRVCGRIFRDRQTGGGDLSCAVVADRDRSD